MNTVCTLEIPTLYQVGNAHFLVVHFKSHHNDSLIHVNPSLWAKIAIILVVITETTIQVPLLSKSKVTEWISMKFAQGPTVNIGQVLVQMIAWRWTDDKLLFDYLNECYPSLHTSLGLNELNQSGLLKANIVMESLITLDSLLKTYEWLNQQHTLWHKLHTHMHTHTH